MWRSPRFYLVSSPIFTLYSINNLPNALLNQPRLYADNNCLLISIPNIEDLNAKSKTELHYCKIWMDLSKLSLNINKIYSLLINIPLFTTLHPMLSYPST